MSHSGRENEIAAIALQRFIRIQCSPGDAFKMAEAFHAMSTNRSREASDKDSNASRPILAAAKEIILASPAVPGLAGMAPSEPPLTGHEGCNDECTQAYVHCRKCGALAHGGLCSEPMSIAKVPRPVLAGEQRKALCPNCKKPFHLNTPCVP